jgi:hypothetical protein
MTPEEELKMIEDLNKNLKEISELTEVISERLKKERGNHEHKPNIPDNTIRLNICKN